MSLSSLDQFDQGIYIAFDERAGDAQRSEALEYCESLKTDENAWRTCLERLPGSTVEKKSEKIRFWYLKVLSYFIDTRYGTLPPEVRAEIRAAFLEYMLQVCVQYPQPNFLAGALATCIAGLIREDFPDFWPDCFETLLSGMEEGPVAIDLVLRSLMALEEDVVDSQVQLAQMARFEQEEAKHLAASGSSSSTSSGSGSAAMRPPVSAVATALKDAMRKEAVPLLVDALSTVLSTYAGSPRANERTLAGLALTLMSRYVVWIEVTLIANEKWMTMLYQFMGMEDLRVHAASVLQALVNKGMDSFKLLQLLEEIQIIEWIVNADLTADANDAPPDQEDKSFSLLVAELCTNCGYNLLANYNDLLKGAAKAATASNGVKDDAAALHWLQSQPQDKQAAITRIEELLDKLIVVVYTCLQHPHFEVGAVTWDFLKEFVNQLRRVGHFVQSREQHFKHALQHVVSSLVFPSWYKPGPENEQDDRDAAFEEYRAQLGDVFKALAALNPAAISEFVLDGLAEMLNELSLVVPDDAPHEAEHLAMCLAQASTSPVPISRGGGSGSSTSSGSRVPGAMGSKMPAFAAAASALAEKVPYEPVEAALHIVHLYADGVGASEISRLSKVDPWLSAITSLITSPVSLHPSPAVCEAYSMTVMRFIGVFEVAPQLAPAVVTGWLDDRGIGSGSARTRALACANLQRFISSAPAEAKAAVVALFDPIFERVSAAVLSVLTRPLRRGRGMVTFNSALHLCEFLGTILNRSMLGAEWAQGYVAVLRMVTEPLNEIHKVRDQWLQQDEELCGKRVAQVLGCIAEIIKKCPPADVREVSEAIDESLTLALAIYEHMPGIESVRDKTIVLLHGVIAAFNEAAVPYLTPFLEPLTVTSNPQNIVQFVQLVNQMLIKFKRDAVGIASSLVGPLFNKLMECIKYLEQQITDAVSTGVKVESGLSELRQRKNGITLALLTFIKTLLIDHVRAVFGSPDVAGLVQNIIMAVDDIVVHTTDIGTLGNCLQVLASFVSMWGQQGSTLDQDMQEFLVYSLTSQLIMIPFRPRFRIHHDAACSTTLRETLNLFRLLSMLLGDPYSQILGENFVSTFGLSDQEVGSLLGLIVSDKPWSVVVPEYQKRIEPAVTNAKIQNAQTQ